MAFTFFTINIQPNAKDLAEIKELLKTMATKQEEFDAKITELSEEITKIQTGLTDIKTAIDAESAQIEEWINNNPNVNTSALNGIVTRLQGVSVQTNALDESIGEIFTPETEETEEKGE